MAPHGIRGYGNRLRLVTTNRGRAAGVEAWMSRTNGTTGTPVLDDSARRSVAPWMVLLLTCVGQFMVVLDISIVNVALPSIQTDLGFSASGLQWVVNAYTLTFAGFLLL